MRKECVKEAATVEEAKALIAAEMECDVADITFDVVQEPQKKTFGLFGGAKAIVKGVVETEQSPAELAKEYLLQVLATMNVEVGVDIQQDEDENGCTLMIDGEDLGFIIGRRGDTLDALQYLVGLVANRGREAYYRVTLDIGNYREKREQALKGLAHKLAAQAARTGRKHSLEPMNPYERRLIHTAVQEVKGATSWSVGSEPNRHVVIGPSDDNPKKNTRSRRGGKGHGKGEGRGQGGTRREKPRDSEYVIKPPERKVREFVPRSNPLPVADGATPPERTKSPAEETATLYGRIDL
ncbi:MAG: protein jag [Ruminococcaceae bacterium]|nr:protein jag [Oscillospiraceae bacterium]